jgi:RNA polymerase sigma-70 factor (ECF subfamily)
LAEPADTDEELVRRARRGDRQAFARLAVRYERPALAVARSVLHSWHDAADAVQDALVIAYERLNRLGTPRKFGAWLLRIARQQALLHRRRSTSRVRRTVTLDGDREAGNRVGEPRGSGPGASADAFALLARLPTQECLVVSLRHLDELSVAEIARVTGRPVGTVTKQLSRAYARMRGWLGEGGDR